MSCILFFNCRLRARSMSGIGAQVAPTRKFTTVVWSVLRNPRPFSTNRALLKRSAEMAEEDLEQD